MLIKGRSDLVVSKICTCFSWRFKTNSSKWKSDFLQAFYRTIPPTWRRRCGNVCSGGLAIAVPGEVHGHYAAWLKFGRVPWADLVLPSAELCEKGFVVEKSLAKAIRQYETTIRNDSNFA